MKNLLLLLILFATSNLRADAVNTISSKDVYNIVSTNKSDYVLIDTRPQSKYIKEHINGALNYEYNDEFYKANVLTKKIIFYCTGNNRAYWASKIAIEKWNFPKIIKLREV